MPGEVWRSLGDGLKTRSVTLLRTVERGLLPTLYLYSY